tara:strand:+ start:3438 stop:4235 length:798 start_codon:yes stop_codon:yes gene_type:complete
LKFNKEYTKYWTSAVDKSIDGTIIAGPNEAKYFLDLISIKSSDSILDLGCSFGRMFDLLSSYSKNIFGVDPDKYAVEKAKKKEYVKVLQGVAEKTGFQENFFDLIFCWATFDVVNHSQGLSEFNRLIKTNGKLLITGKNSNYYDDDILAFKAEKNAFIKDFPNKFTNLDTLLKNFGKFGFNLIDLFLFPKRGDFGKLNFELTNPKLNKSNICYEYLIICEKCSDITQNITNINGLDQISSETAGRLAKKQGFSNAKEIFESIGID